MKLNEKQLEQISGGKDEDYINDEHTPIGFLPGTPADYPWADDLGHCPDCGGTDFDHLGWGVRLSYQFYQCNCGTIFRK